MKYNKKTTNARNKLLREVLTGDPDTPTSAIRQRFADAKLLPPPGHGTIAEARASARKSRAQSKPAAKPWTEDAIATQKVEALEPVVSSTHIGDDRVVVLIGTTKGVSAVLRQVLNREQ